MPQVAAVDAHPVPAPEAAGGVVGRLRRRFPRPLAEGARMVYRTVGPKGGVRVEDWTVLPETTFKGRPVTPLRSGNTVLDVARLVHREIADELKFARIWGENVYDGQQTGPEHVVEDGDVVELHL